MLFFFTMYLTNIIVKIENGEVVYKAQVNNGDEIKVYPVKSLSWNAFAEDKEKRKEIKEELVNYSIAKYKIFVSKYLTDVSSDMLHFPRQQYTKNEKR